MLTEDKKYLEAPDVLRQRYPGISSEEKFSDSTEDCDCISKEHFHMIFGRVPTFFIFIIFFSIFCCTQCSKLNGKIHEILIYLMRSSYTSEKEKIFSFDILNPSLQNLYSVVISNIMEHIRNR